MGNAMRHRHEHGSRRAVAADVGDEDAPFPFGKREEIIIIAPCPGGRLIVDGQVHGRNPGQLGRQQRALDLADHLQLLVQRLVGLLQFVREHQVAGGPAKQIAQPHHLRKLVPRKAARLLLEQQHHIQRDALIVKRNGQQRALPGQVLGRGVVRLRLEVIDNPWQVSVNQPGEQSSLQHW